ncbi:N-alpha-acetyltransferase 16, NatA auxiliary subunit [Dionaea muscipula]
MMGVKPSHTPMLHGIKLVLEEGKTYDDPDRYMRLVDKLNYLTVTRLDIIFSVSVASQFMFDPRSPHWEVALHILKYIKEHPSRGLLYSDDGHRRIEGFSDADWTSSPFDRKSMTDYCVFVGGNLVSWKSKKQSLVARSSAELEYRALTYLTSDVTFLQQLLDELHYPAPRPTQLWCGNLSAIHIGSNLVFHERIKHIEVDCHFVREKLQGGDIALKHVKTTDQLADILIKSL